MSGGAPSSPPKRAMASAIAALPAWASKAASSA